MKRLVGRLLVLIMLLAAVSYPAWADPCRDCDRARKAAALKREARVYRQTPCPECPDTVRIVKAEQESNAAWIIGALLLGGTVGYLIGHDSRKTKTVVIQPKKR